MVERTVITGPPEPTMEVQYYEKRWELWRDCLLASLRSGAGWVVALDHADKIAESYRLRCMKDLGLDLQKGDETCA